MKLVLMALVIEISLARIFTGSWGLAMLVVFIYCTIVYIVVSRKGLSIKKRIKNKTKIEFGYPVMQV
jgi:TRAP-type C4-dicarboxylate transport system permease large subunit